MESHTGTKLGTCCSSSFVTDDQAGYTLCSAAFFPCSLLSEDPPTLPGSSWLHRVQQLGLTLQLLLQGQPYLVPCGRLPSCYQKEYAGTQFTLRNQN